MSAASTDPDFLIIGAGAAGGVVAKALATGGFRIVVLEQGPWLREPEFKHDEIWANRRHALTNDYLRQPNTCRLTEAETRRLADHLRWGGRPKSPPRSPQPRRFTGPRSIISAT